MATLARLQGRLPDFKEDYYHRNRYVNEYRKQEYYAAVKIQSWFRGCKVRAYIRYLNKMMVYIQKWWRGYRGRKKFRKMVEIQKRWRGYYIRKYIHNYYALKKYLEAIALNNEIVRRELEEFAEMKEKEEEKKALEREKKKKDYLARKMHYLLSTAQIAGVYNSPYRLFPDPMELELRKVKPLRLKAKESKTESTDSHWLACSDSFGFHPGPSPLPPIGRQKPQGPFREPTEVWQQRFKPLDPSLVLEPSCITLQVAREKLRQEEWRNRVHDNVFLPFSYNIPAKYVPSMQRASQYGQSSYGLKHFREEHPEKWIANRVSYIGKLKQSYSFVDLIKISKSISSISDSQGQVSRKLKG
ncbi:hypothetical protein lerEdw1_018918 [Lerista edwardsae]|nr:hypothetical protein lerEdw1_018918 [Lerista edwardsae]